MVAGVCTEMDSHASRSSTLAPSLMSSLTASKFPELAASTTQPVPSVVRTLSKSIPGSFRSSSAIWRICGDPFRLPITVGSSRNAGDLDCTIHPSTSTSPELAARSSAPCIRSRFSSSGISSPDRCSIDESDSTDGQ